MEIMNHLETVLETSVRDWPVRGESSVKAGVPQAAMKHGSEGMKFVLSVKVRDLTIDLGLLEFKSGVRHYHPRHPRGWRLTIR